ncbi:pantetheine-phosphate adenylyltransferase [Lactobacillus amylovorus]|jgi:pantetheine-phosphate adenylyltransferase|uniref:Phosphopantetheine adenylyltransferase n=3 Tax=Lactobacillus amylovorus TaxID=1604 RepID=E4SI51_LACAR|nr:MULTISPECIES: pantetheine-phosphate adenylyltransferase [Lactobacillus]CDA26692.1 phosphopantetheine adenylyltransferase [Lactobacillus amylovorus CAG:719]HBQ09043.1 pantetheine-phosphate adenylyltransferase [Lactobacillus sp.]ADQ58850.1 phosphopantetheine adenylyltransferase [Lactobacillus amylovorus GRL 1112]MCT3596598.1 pantetheine-phosphate adenylyltransferase [Lactobacillus amylovorus]MDB6221262.1 pantetheine-phosphate adenylyltransferase [Lactobacillus amylovorus]
MTVALFPGSFDPITNGHVETAKKAAQIFDKVYVVAMTNTSKHYLFTAKERADFIRDALKDIPNIEVLDKPDMLTVNLAHELHARAIVRGVRNSADFRYEQEIAGINKRLAPDINTVLLFSSPENSFVASSMIKELARFDEDVHQFLPERAAKALRKKLNHEQSK